MKKNKKHIKKIFLIMLILCVTLIFTSFRENIFAESINVQETRNNHDTSQINGFERNLDNGHLYYHYTDKNNNKKTLDYGTGKSTSGVYPDNYKWTIDENSEQWKQAVEDGLTNISNEISVTSNESGKYYTNGKVFFPRKGVSDVAETENGGVKRVVEPDGTTISNANSCGWYWSSTLNSVGSAYAQGLCFFPSLLTNVSDHERCDGHNIRPVYIRSLTPTDDNGGVDYGNGDIDDNSNLNGNVIGDIYYNISDENGEYSSVEGCITLKKSISDSDMNNIVGKNIFSEDFKNDFTGIVFMVQAGQGTIKVNAESLGSMTLKVKIGNSTPMTFELEGKMKASIPYSVTEPTYVYIYGGETSTANARGLRAVSSDNALKIYGIEWSGEATSIEFINRNVETKAVIYNLNGQRVEKPSKGIYIKNGKKVVIK